MLVALHRQEELVMDSLKNVVLYNLLNLEGIYSKTSLIFSVLFTITPHPKKKQKQKILSIVTVSLYL